MGTAFCLQIMSSAFIRALADKASLANRHAPSAMLHAKKLYKLSVRIDPQNWRAYKGMAQLTYTQRYYGLNRTEKQELAAIEKVWYEKAYAQNPKDPEIIRGLGKSLIFLGRSCGAGILACPDPLCAGKDACATKDSGLDLLREACRYRNFNDSYWWTLGVELRKAGLYEEAIEVFQYAATIKSTPSIKMNIAWLKVKLSGAIDPQTSDSKPAASEAPDNLPKPRSHNFRQEIVIKENGSIETEGNDSTQSLRLQREEVDLSELLDRMKK